MNQNGVRPDIDGGVNQRFAGCNTRNQMVDGGSTLYLQAIVAIVLEAIRLQQDLQRLEKC